MSKKELKEIVKRVQKEVLSKEPFAEVFKGLLEINFKLNAMDDEDFKAGDISAITSRNCTEEEVREIRDAIVKKLKKEFGKKHSYFVTTKIMLSLWALSEKFKETDLCSNRERFCYLYVENYEYVTEEFEEALRRISLLD